MAISTVDGKFQVAYWREEARIEGAPDGVEYSDFAMELKDRIQKLLRQGEYAYAALFQWNAAAQDWEPVEEFARRTRAPG